VIVDNADGLHESIADGRANESEASFLQVTGHSLRFYCLSWHVFECDNAGSSLCLVFRELPYVVIEATVFILHLQDASGVIDYGLYLEPVSHNTGISEQSSPIGFSVSRYLRHIKVIECPPEIIPLP
jgi:hypothetical protein